MAPQLQRTMLTKTQLNDHAARMKALDRVGQDIMQGLITNEMVLFWDRGYPGMKKPFGEMWTMVNGNKTPVYISLRSLSSVEGDPTLYDVHVPKAYQLLLRDIGALDAKGRPMPKHKIVTLPMTGLAIGDAIRLSTGMPHLYVRKLPEGVLTEDQIAAYLSAHGNHSLVEGVMKDGDVLILGDDLANDAKSKIMGISQIRLEAKRRGVDVTVKHVLPLIDRESGGAAALAQAGYEMRAVVRFVTRGIPQMAAAGVLTPLEAEHVPAFFKDVQKYQTPEMQEELKRLALEARRPAPEGMVTTVAPVSPSM